MPSRPADVDFPEISLVRWIGSVDDGQVLVVRTELRQRERQLRSPGLFTLQKKLRKLTSAAAALGLGVACHRPSRT